MLLWDIFIFNNQLIGYITKLSPPKHVQNYNDCCNLILALIHSRFPLLYTNISSIIKPILKYMRIDCTGKSYNILIIMMMIIITAIVSGVAYITYIFMYTFQ